MDDPEEPLFSKEQLAETDIDVIKQAVVIVAQLEAEGNANRSIDLSMGIKLPMRYLRRYNSSSRINIIHFKGTHKAI